MHKEHIAFDSQIDYEIRIKKAFNTVYDLAYTMVDLQALITGISRVIEENENNYRVYRESASEIANTNIYEIDEIKQIDYVLNRYKSHIDKEYIDDIKEELGLVVRKPVAIAAVDYEKPFPTTARNFNKKYKDLLRLNSFENGSLVLDVTSTVIAELIIKFIDKFISKDSGKKNTIEIKITDNRNVFIFNDGTFKKVQSFENLNIHDVYSEKDLAKLIPVSNYVDSLIRNIEVDNQSIEHSVKSLLKVLSDEGIISNKVLYDKRGIKTIVADIERFKGSIIDSKC